MAILRVAAFQRYPSFDDVPGSVARLLADLTWCDEQGVDLVVFPECYLQGYASDRETIVRRALPLDGDVVTSILTALAPYRATIVLGLVERRGTKFYNTAAVIHAGCVIGTYVKYHTNEQGFDAGTESPVFDIAGWPFGINICYDANFPDAALRLSRQGARLLCYPLNNMLAPLTAARWRRKSVANLRQRAMDTGCWVVSADVVGTYEGKLSYGCTCVVRPDGVIVERAVEGTEQAVVYDLS